MEKVAILKIFYRHTDKPELNVSSSIAEAIQPVCSNSSLFLHVPVQVPIVLCDIFEGDTNKCLFTPDGALIINQRDDSIQHV